jgi:hypothetical protein
MKMIFVGVFVPHSTNVSQVNALRRQGVEVIEYSYRAELSKYKSIEERDNALISLIQIEKPDAVLFSKCSRMGFGVIEEARKWATCIYWFMDWDRGFRRALLRMASGCHYAFISRRGSLEKLKKYAYKKGSNTSIHLLCEGFDADVDYPQDVPKIRDVCFIGRPRKERGVYTKALNIPVIRNCFRDDHSRTVSETRVNINFSEGDGCSDRVYKILAAGGFLLTQPWVDLEDHFTPGIHLDVFGTQEELSEKINYYLNNADKRKEIAINGLKCVQKFSRDSWASKIINTVSIKGTPIK